MALVYTTKEAAQLLKVDIKTIYKLKDEHKLQAVKVGSKILITEQSINNYLGIIPAKTENEIRLEEENKRLKEKLRQYERHLSQIKDEILKIDIKAV
ncbi:helix-turn-helix domain-containing protein [Thermoanaerobacterium sp. R66]|uniref:helix-turn-helix domain-containing protein n=1 Tax=Thermoanaerobacterium sp. R66 TaxID=2742479 RepID=UPI00237FE466|nr:helix-turn-helix domain-containing protein [Thermoanaerobacterium sp. R66]MDE4542292.1 helix-turn-helix domain-containing protein [Thermoanaerobacterium sp. R66]